MAEDICALSHADAIIYLPEITIYKNHIIRPRCPMEIGGTKDIIARDNIKNNDIYLSYINMSAEFKYLSDGVYNGTEALRILQAKSSIQSKVTVNLYGDRNVNWWISRVAENIHTNLRVEAKTPELYCPPHNEINYDAFILLLNKLIDNNGKNNVGVALHSETNSRILEYGLQNNYYIGGTTGMLNTIKNTSIKTWLIPTIYPFVQRLRCLTGKCIHSPKILCPAMSYTTVNKVNYARNIINEQGPCAEIFLDEDLKYRLKINDESRLRYHRGRIIIPAVQLSIHNDVRSVLKKKLLPIVNFKS